MSSRPQRTCIGCRHAKAPEELVRLTVERGGGLAVGRGRPGRGAWLCAGSTPCFETARRRRAFGRALRAPVEEEDLTELRGRLFSDAAATFNW